MTPRWVPAFVAVAFMTLGMPSNGSAADVWGGSLVVTSDYLVRGISRSGNDPALQADYHYLSASGWVAGVFASSAQTPDVPGTEAALSAFVGYAWSQADDWHGKALVSHYAYTRNHYGARYDYDELDVDVAYQDWLDVELTYSPNFQRFVPYLGLTHVDTTSAEVDLQYPVVKKLFVTGGGGYSYQTGADAQGYVYWSIGAAYDLAPVSLALAYVDTSAAARTLFYDDAVRGKWVGTVIWRF